MYNKLLMNQTLNTKFSQNKIYASINNFVKKIMQFNKKQCTTGKIHEFCTADLIKV